MGEKQNPVPVPLRINKTSTRVPLGMAVIKDPPCYPGNIYFGEIITFNANFIIIPAGISLSIPIAFVIHSGPVLYSFTKW